MKMLSPNVCHTNLPIVFPIGLVFFLYNHFDIKIF